MANDYYNCAPHNTYPCRGHDRWIAIAVGTDEQWRAMVQVMMNPEWAVDARFANQDGRFQHRAEIDRHVAEWTRQYDNRWLMERLQRTGVPAGVLNDDADAYSDPHLASRGFFQELSLPDAGVHRYPGIIWELLKTPNLIRQSPAQLGQHNPFVYRDLFGFDDEEYARLEQEGHIGDRYPDHLP